MVTFVYDPIEKMAEAALNVFPDLKAEIQFNPEIKSPGITTFPKNGSVPLIEINAELTLSEVVEQMAKELAFVAVGSVDENNPEWHKAHNEILQEFERIVISIVNNYQINKK